MNMDRALHNLVSFILMLDKDNLRQTPCRGGRKRGEWICMGVSTSRDVRQAEKHVNERQGHNHYHYKQKPITLNSHIIKSTNAFLPKKNQLHIHTITIVTATFMA